MKTWAICLVAIAGLLLGAGWLVKSAADTVAGMVTDAGAAARAERDAHWQAEIANSNAEIEQIRRENLEHVIAIDVAANERIAAAERSALETRKDNDALPDDGSCGLSADRVKLLNR
jgi:predicted transglutaminase-like cysteine proteinase